MLMGQNEAFSRVLIDKALEFSGWNLLNPQQVHFELQLASGRADYLLKDKLGRVLCVLEAKREGLDPYDAKEQARGYAENLKAPFVILSNGREHWFWNYERADQHDAYRVERLPSPDDLERLRYKNLQPSRPLESEVVRPDYLTYLKQDLTLRRYQIKALDEVARLFDKQARKKFLLEMATGTGKTLLCAALIRRFLATRNAERVLFIVDRIELAKQTMEDFAVVLPEFKPVVFKSARRSGELLGASVVVATIQSLMVDRRYREHFTPFYFDLVINDEAHRSIYGDAREVVQFFQATRIGLTATPKAYLKNIDIEALGSENPKALEARQLRDTYNYFGCEPGRPTYRYDIIDAVKDPEGPFLCLPKIFDMRSDITTQALVDKGWAVVVNEQEENFKIQDLERKILTPARNQLMCEAFLNEAQKDPTGALGKSIVFAVNQSHATALTKIFNGLQPNSAVTITSRIPGASAIAKEFRDGKRPEKIAVSVDMLSTGYNGVLFAGTKAAKSLRELLLTECDLQAVVGMPSGVFKPYSGVGTAALIFEKGSVGSGQAATESVWFYDLTADGFSLDDKRLPVDANDIPDVLAKWPGRAEGPNTYRVAIEKIKANDWSLAAGRYKPVTAQAVTHDPPDKILAEVLAIEEDIAARAKRLQAMLKERVP
jgi:type I site-specific restriction endonuclease